MATQIATWFLSTVRGFNPFLGESRQTLQVGETAASAGILLSEIEDANAATSKHIRLSQNCTATSTTQSSSGRSASVSSLERSPPRYIFPEPTQHLQVDGEAFGRYESRGVGSRLDLARHAALDQAAITPVSSPSRVGAPHIEIEEDESTSQAEQQLLGEAKIGAVRATNACNQGSGRIWASEEYGESDGCVSKVPMRVLSLVWRVNSEERVTGAALLRRSVVDPDLDPMVLRIVKPEPGLLSSPSVGVLQADVGMKLQSNLSPTSSSVMKTTADLQLHDKAASSPHDSFASKQRSAVSVASTAKTKKIKNSVIDVASSVEVVGKQEVLNELTRPRRTAAKRANKATKTALWTESLHDETFLKRAEMGHRKTMRAKE